MRNLRAQTLKALFWNFSGTGGRLGVQLLIQIWLARLLVPKDFGLMAMLMIFTSLGLVFIEGGFGTALVHQKDSNHEDESSVFFCNLAAAALVSTILILIAPFVADFYGQLTLTTLLPLASVGLFFGAFGVVHNALLTRALDFRSLTIANLASSVIAGAIAITCAKIGMGVWSLAWQFVAASAIRSIALWWLSPWRPRWLFRTDSVRRLAAYGSRLVASNIISTLSENLNQLLIGRFYTASDLGHYSRAQTMQSIPINTFSQALSGVLLPALVHLNDQPAKFRAGYRNAIRCSLAISIPMMGFLALVAEPLFLILLSDKWLPAVPYFQVFCISGCLYPLHMINLNCLLASGKSDFYLNLEIFKRIITVIAAMVALPFGVMAFALSSIPIGALGVVANTHYTKKLISYGIFDQLRDMLPFVISLAVALPIAWIVTQSCPTSNPWLHIGTGFATFTPLYLIMLYLTARETCVFIVGLAKQIRPGH